ncbi:zinc-finger of mitochondrial splicing suppressor 51-domain-containing protein, partial [Piptocephalis cylindrospora]
KDAEPSAPLLVQSDDLFHPLSQSPIPEVRERAKLIKEHSHCPVCTAKSGGKERVAPAFECPDCGHPTHCSEEHWREDQVDHALLCPALRRANEDEHDLRSGRTFPEFDFPGPQHYDEAINFANWDTFFYTRRFQHLDSERSAGHVTKLLTFPITIASLLHPASPYRPGRDLTPAGTQALAAIRSTLAQQNQITSQDRLTRREPVRIFIVGSRAEGYLPPSVWAQLSHLFPRTPFHLHLIGPQAVPPGQAPGRRTFSSGLSITLTDKLLQEVTPHLTPFDPYRDLFFLFSPGIGYPGSRDVWEGAIRSMVDTKCPIFFTGYSPEDVERDVQEVKDIIQGMDVEWLMHPTESIFRCLKPDVNPTDLSEIGWDNWGLYGIRGRRFEVIE